jgi:hypothetical protein
MVDELSLIPHEGLGPVRFGMSAEEVHNACGSPSWRRGPQPFLPFTREEFEDYHFFVDFDAGGACRSIEVYPGVRMMLNGVDIMAMSYGGLVRHIRQCGHAIVENADGFRCEELGLACYAPAHTEPDGSEAQVESLFAHPRGYWAEVDVLVANDKL